ncbi:MAG: phage tail protein [Prochloraceae cyanobacterium]
MSEPFLGEIRMVGFNFPPRGWAFCDGQLLSISENTALYSLLGTTYGGDGRTNFALPDLRGAFPLGQGQRPSGSLYRGGERGGSETINLTQENMPAHTHALVASNQAGNSTHPGNKILAESSEGDSIYGDTQNKTNMNSDAIGSTGGDRAVNKMPPFLTVYYIIALEGIFPPRN